MEFLLPSKARLAEAIKGDEEEEEGEGDMIDGLALINDKLVGKNTWNSLLLTSKWNANINNMLLRFFLRAAY